ncbi:MAG: hypothetical protein KKA54_11450 [Proteobacteria bacterium]|nr:hypothetical protein [Pseudomonadota bacterium]
MKSKIELEVIAYNNSGGPRICKGGICPTIYKSKDGRFFVQGVIVDSNITETINPPENETVVEVTEELLKNLIQNMK